MRIKKVLSLAVVLAMVLTVVPVAFAADGDIAADKLYGWNFNSDAKRPQTFDEYKVQDAQSAIVSFSNNRAGFAEFTLPEDTNVAAGQILRATFKVQAWSNNGANDRISKAAIFAVDPAAVEAENNALLDTAVEGRVLVGTLSTSNVSNSWTEVTSQLRIPADKIVGGKVAFLLSNIHGGDATGGVASLKDAYLADVKVLSPDAAVNVRIMDGGNVLEESNPNGNKKEYFAGDKFSLNSCNKYLVKNEKLYELALPEIKEITLSEGNNNYDITAKHVKNVEGTVTGTNDGFENGINGWTNIPNEEYEIVKGENQKTEGSQALWLKGVAGAAGTVFGGTWNVDPNTRYLVSFDVMPTKQAKDQYMWLYVTDANGTGEADDPCADWYADKNDNTSQKLQQMTLHTLNQFETKQFIVWTGSKQTKLGFKTAWVGNDTQPIIDNFKITKLSNLENDDVDYVINAKYKGQTVATIEKQTGKVGETVKVAENQVVDQGRAASDGKIITNRRIADKYYTNKASDQDTIIATTTKEIEVEAELTATITGPDSIDINTLEGYNYVLPTAIKTTVDSDAVTAEELPVTWEDTTGTIADTGLTLTANVVTHEKTFDPTAGMTVGSNSVINNQGRTFSEMYRFPKEISDKFTVAFTLVAKQNGDNAIGFFKYDAKGTDAYGTNLRIHLPIGGDKIYYRDNAAKKEFMTMELNQSYAFIVDVDVTNNTYNLSVRNESSGEGKMLMGIPFRNNGGIDGVSFFGNNPSSEGDLEISKFAVYAGGVDVPATATLTAGLGFAADGDSADTLGITFTADGAYDGQTLKVTAIDLHETTNEKGGKGVDNTTIDTSVLSNGAPSVLVIPKKDNGSNIYYMARLVDTNSGYLIAQAEASLYELLANDIKTNLSDYKDTLNREKFDAKKLEQAIAILSTGGVVLDDKNAINDVRKEFIKVTSSEAGTTIELDKALYDNGIGFKVSTIVDVNGTDKTATQTEGLFYKITINGNDVTCEGVDGAMIFSLDSVEIEFVSTEIAETEADSAGAEVDFIPEL